nr:DNA methyltransferase [Agrococcus sp. KRD186]
MNDLLRKLETTDAALAKDLKREVDALAHRRAFGLNFERHVPEAVELPGRPVRRGDKVRILPPRGSKANAGDDRLWRVIAIEKDFAGARTATLELIDDTAETAASQVDDLVVVAEFRDPIYPGLVSTGKVERGGDKPYHAVINAENYHALQTLLFTHRGKVDAIYIDPPYNTGAKDWKYNNDYVEGEDLYRHSKWLAFMERRLKLAKELLNPDDSVLIVTIDEKEYLRLGMLLEQTFTSDAIQMVTSVINPMGSRRADEFSRVEEYVFVVRIGTAAVPDTARTMLDRVTDKKSVGETEVRWTPLNRDGNGWERSARPNLFYPVFVDPVTRTIAELGESLSLTDLRSSVPDRAGLVTVWPMKGDREARWQVGQSTLKQFLEGGWVSVGSFDPDRRVASIRYLTSGAQAKVASGAFRVTGRRPDGSNIVVADGAVEQRPRSVWVVPSHSARDFGTSLLRAFLPDRKFPYPKSLYAVEDALRFFVGSKPQAIVLDFFAGSGTTTHAVLRLNKQDNGFRRSVSITNNEVGPADQADLRKDGFRPGDPEWERWGICDHITEPRIAAAITGNTPAGDSIKGDYKFTDEFAMADGFDANVEFFALTYEAPLRVSSHREFAKVAPLLWLRAGSEGRRIDDVSSGWDVADTYGVLADLNQADDFVEAIAAQAKARLAFIVTDEDRLFEAVVRDLPDHVEPVRLYEAYLHNFEIETGRSAL